MISERPNLVSAFLLFSGVMAGLNAQGAERAAPDRPPRVVFLVSEDPDNYEAHKTIPVFAKLLQDRFGCRSTVIQGKGIPNAFRFAGLEALKETDLLVVFFRRRALSTEQLGMIRGYLASGRPLVGIRTANHAFSVHGNMAEGYGKWWEFVPEVLGCGNHGYGAAKLGTDVAIVPEAARHPVLTGVKRGSWHSGGSLYLVKPIDKKATILLTGSAGDKTEPIAWVRSYKGSRVFYTSLGYPDDFERPDFRGLLVNGCFWALGRPVPEAGGATEK